MRYAVYSQGQDQDSQHPARLQVVEHDGTGSRVVADNLSERFANRIAKLLNADEGSKGTYTPSGPVSPRY